MFRVLGLWFIGIQWTSTLQSEKVALPKKQQTLAKRQATYIVAELL